MILDELQTELAARERDGLTRRQRTLDAVRKTLAGVWRGF